MTSGQCVTVVGGGLAGSEAAWQLAEVGYDVELFEMRPTVQTPAHQTGELAEIVCTNSFKSEALNTAHGLLKAEMRQLGCMLLQVADATRVEAGSALAVDRRLFAAEVTRRIKAHPRISVRSSEITQLPAGAAIIATGPLTSDALSEAVRSRLGEAGLAFFDAIAPIFSRESIDEEVAWLASRYDRGAAAYLNCPFDRAQYETFVAELLAADVYEGHDWDEVPYFEGCLPIEVMAQRGVDTLRFGPLRPVGLPDPQTGRIHHAVAQLRTEDRDGRMWNLVGFQTRLRIGEQERVFRLIPGLQEAEFLRHGSVHRNSYINFPKCLTEYGSLPDCGDLIFAGQLTGVEGYTESIASGLLAAGNLDRVLSGQEAAIPPGSTMLGGLYRYLREADPTHFQPMNANFGLVDSLPNRVKGKSARREALATRALEALEAWQRQTWGDPSHTPSPAAA
ncbi:MAG: methylenetetrahydrofolate--tRNA-(uracil(54)-C(5))-methyltransferase (FADH(2)-oxidizing) TrmFO [Gemmatimonadota bacterium]